MLALGYCSIMTDLSTAWCIPLVPLQAAYWDISVTDAGRNMSGIIFVSSDLSLSDRRCLK